MCPPRSAPVTQRGFGTDNEAFFQSDCSFACPPGQVGTSRVAEEDEAPDTSHAADDQADGQHGTVRHLPAQPAYEEESQDDLHPTQAVHQAVGQLAEAEEALCQRSHHGLKHIDVSYAE